MLVSIFASRFFMDGSRGGGAVGPDPPDKSLALRVLSITGLDPLKNHKLPSQNSMMSHHWRARETPFIGVSLAG